MSTIILDNKKEKSLQPAHLLWKLYQPEKARFRFKAKSEEEANNWQQKTRNVLKEKLGFSDLPNVPFSARTIEIVDKGDYIRKKIVIRTSPASSMPFYFLKPKNRPKRCPAVIAFNGHGYGVKDIVGLWEDGAERNTPDGYQKDFAVALCKRGFIVVAPQISCFGERQTDFSYINTLIGQEVPAKCTHAAMLAFHLGGSVIGLRIHDGVRLIDYLETCNDIDLTKIGAMGISGGGMHTFFSMCLDQRIKAGVISGYYCTFKDSILAIDHCPCNFVPGLHQFGEMYDLIGLIAPRPLLIEAGNYDQHFPFHAVKRSVEIAKGVYRVFAAEDQLKTDYFEGRHQISGRIAYDFLYTKLFDER